MASTSLIVQAEDGVFDPTSSPGMWANWITQDHRQPWQFPRHLQLLDQKLVDVARGKIKRLMVFMPPRHGKSELCSKYFPAWYLGTFPDRRIIVCGYGNDFAQEWGRKARDLLEEYGPAYFGQTVNPRSGAAENWNLLRRDGGMISAGVGGGITGRGADVLLIDDPIKGAKDAQSETNRTSVWNWYQSEAYSRLSPDGAIIIINTRWHRDDLSGVLLKQQLDTDNEIDDEPWTVVSLPAIAEEAGDALGRQIGDALWPERWTIDRLLKKKSRTSAYWWNALYQQRPTQHDSAEWPDSYFHEGIWFDRWPEHKETQFRVMAVDPSLGKRAQKGKGDYSAIIMLTLDTQGRMFVDASIERRSAVQLVEDVCRYGRGFRPHRVGVESNGFQELLLPMFTERSKVEGFGLPLAAIYNVGKTKKEDRIRLVGPFLERSEFRFKRGSKGTQLLIDQLKEFPLGDHDDGPDALEMGVRMAQELWSGAADPARNLGDLPSRYDGISLSA